MLFLNKRSGNKTKAPKDVDLRNIGEVLSWLSMFISVLVPSYSSLLNVPT